jgi:hypothetical protein
MRWPMREMHAHERHACGMASGETHAYERCPYEMAAYERHAYEMAYGRDMLMRCTLL